jgi:5'-nucleotidase
MRRGAFGCSARRNQKPDAINQKEWKQSMKSTDKKPAAELDRMESLTLISRKTLSRREFMAVSAAAGATILLPGALSAALDGKKTFTILHTNDMHSAFIGMGPAADYTPDKLNDDTTRGGYARLAALIAKRMKERKDQGPVLVLDAGDYSMGTAFGAASREAGGELQLMFRMGCDAVTFGNHEFDLGPDGLGKSIGVAAKAGRVPTVVASNTNFAGKDETLADLQRLANRHLRVARERGQLLHQRRGCGFVSRRHRDCQGDGDDSPRG